MSFRTIFTKWTAVPAAILLLGIVGTLLSWQSLAKAEFRLNVASETSEATPDPGSAAARAGAIDPFKAMARDLNS
jgi:hypothetical protein